MPIIKRWTTDYLADTIVYSLLNKFDFFIVIEGKRSLSKSTGAYRIARAVAIKFRKIKPMLDMPKADYSFKPERDLLYDRSEVTNFWNKRNKIGIADEMINAGFLRDFWNQEQNDLIKLINMNRDHYNLFIACIPRFNDLDNKLKNLCKMRITCVRRGIGIIQTPNKSIYSNDIWDTKVNERIERDWIKKGIKNPKYSRLTTFRGIWTFNALPKEVEERYQKIKDEKRTRLRGGNPEENQPMNPFDSIYDKLVNGKIKNKTILEGLAMSMDISIDQIQDRLRRRLRKENKDTAVASYYWEKNKINQEKTKLKGLLESIET